MKISLIFINIKVTGSANTAIIIGVSAKFQLKVRENEDAFCLHLSSLTPWIPSTACSPLHEDPRVRTPCSKAMNVHWSGDPPWKRNASDIMVIKQVSVEVWLLLGLLFCSTDEFICPYASVHYGFIIFLLSRKANIPVSSPSHTSGVYGFSWFCHING